MANVVPAFYPLPDPGAVLAGEPVVVPVGQDILDASNYFAATPRVGFSQGWNPSDDIVQRVAAFPVMPAIGSFGAHVTAWPLAPYGVRTDLEVLAVGWRDGAAGNVRFRSVATGDTVDLALGAAVGYTAVGALTVDTSGGADWIELYLEGDGVDPAHVLYAYGDHPLITGALPAPGADEPTPFDEDELAADEPWSADTNDYLLGNLDLYLGWLQPFYVWSGVQNVTTGSKASYSQPEWDHQVVTSLHRGQLRNGLEWAGKARVANVGGGDEAVVLAIGAQGAHGREAFDVPGPAGAKTVTATFAPSELDISDRELRGFATVEHPMVFITIVGDRNFTTADLRSVGLWGV